MKNKGKAILTALITSVLLITGCFPVSDMLQEEYETQEAIDFLEEDNDTVDENWEYIIEAEQNTDIPVETEVVEDIVPEFEENTVDAEKADVKTKVEAEDKTEPQEDIKTDAKESIQVHDNESQNVASSNNKYDGITPADSNASKPVQPDTASNAGHTTQKNAEIKFEAPTPEPTPAPTYSTGCEVWIPQSGSKYHSHSGCSNMKNPSCVSLETAKSMGYEPCKRCY